MKPSRILTILLILLLSVHSGFGQTPAPQAEKIRQQVRKIGLAGEITIILHTGAKHHGALTAIEADHLEVAEVDQ